ncbi:hypothetical protein [Phaeobacter inhibens]|uniref:hypothetical protein n=1 Tax=Phaeobacter inhibens TaxID=221822 RepID=UPI0009EAE661|nr:hypothetical protein [Phaeobacter inhibens]WHP67314.1 hypothetical protein QMZ01_12265 [Phaeobacter inhibens]
MYKDSYFEDDDFEKLLMCFGNDFPKFLRNDSWVEKPLPGLNHFKKFCRLLSTSPQRNGILNISIVDLEGSNNLIRAKSSKIHPGCQFIGNVIVGPRTEIGPNSVIFGPTIIGPDSYIGPFAEVRRSIIGQELMLSHASYLGHSIVGQNVNIGAYFVSAVRNMKRKTVSLKLDDTLVDTKEELFGVFIGSNTEFGVRVTTFPGRRIGRDKTIAACSKITGNIY